MIYSLFKSTTVIHSRVEVRKKLFKGFCPDPRFGGVLGGPLSYPVPKMVSMETTAQDPEMVPDNDAGNPWLSRSNEEVRDQLAHCHHMRTRWDVQLMRMVVEVERRSLYVEDGYESTSEWLSCFLGRGYVVSQKFLGVALAVSRYPALEQGYLDGKLSYDHLRALADVVTEDNQHQLVAKAEHMSVASTFALAGRIRKLGCDDSMAARANRYLQMSWDHHNRVLCFQGCLPEEQGVIFEKTIQALADKMPHDQEALFPASARRADALFELAARSPGGGSTVPQVIVHVDADALSSGEGVAEIERGPAISAESARRLSCDSVMQVMVHGPDGQVVTLGPNRRSIPRWVRRMVFQRDQRCKYPGCRKRKLVECHHIVHRQDGGSNDPSNLVLFCAFHHHLVHEGKYEVRGSPPKIWIERPGREALKVGPPCVPQRTKAMFDIEFAMPRTEVRRS